MFSLGLWVWGSVSFSPNSELPTHNFIQAPPVLFRTFRDRHFCSGKQVNLP